jgi:small-conductance mechanosensitive channel
VGVAGRDLMANYFTGLSMKMDIPYEIGDRVKIDNSEILEVRSIGLRNDKFYEISSNSIISIPHSRLASNTIKNYTYPTLDYRSELSIYVKNNLKSLKKTPREAEKVLLVSAFINTGVKLPKISKEITDKIKIQNIDIGKELFQKDNNKRYSYIEDKLSEKNSDFKNKIEEIWEVLKDIDKNEDRIKHKSSFFRNLFIEKLPIDISANQEENLYIKKVIIAIVNSVIEYQDLIDLYFFSKSDKYGVRRKYNVFNNLDVKLIEEFADILVNISFYYYMLANRLWELKDKQTSFAQKRKIDNSMIQILNVPRISSLQEFNDENNIWKVTLFVTLELSEQSDETLHHINMYIDKIWDIFLK